MKNYLANKSFSRGVETLGAEASMVFVGNTQYTVPYMLKHADLFCSLPDKFYDSAFLDRIHFYIPGWEVAILRGEMFSSGYGFVVDYLAEILRALRKHDYSDRYKAQFSLSADISTRDRDGINKTFSGLMKILFPHGEATEKEIEELLRFAIEGRKRVKDQLLRIDSTYGSVRFSYLGTNGQAKPVTTLEEETYPNAYHKAMTEDDDGKAWTLSHRVRLKFHLQPGLWPRPSLFSRHSTSRSRRTKRAFPLIRCWALISRAQLRSPSPTRTSACFTSSATSWNCWRPSLNIRLRMQRSLCIW